MMVFVVVTCGNGNTTTNQGKSAEDNQSGLARRIRRGSGWRCCDFRRQFVFAKGNNGIIAQPAIRLLSDQRALPLTEVVVNDQIGAIIESNVKVITLTFADQSFRRQATCGIRELVVSPIHCRYVLRRAGGIQRVGGKSVAGGGLQSKGNVSHVGFPDSMIVLPVFSATESTGRVAAALCHEVGEELAEKHAYLSGAKRDECWVLGLPPSGAKPGFLGCRQAG